MLQERHFPSLRSFRRIVLRIFGCPKLSAVQNTHTAFSKTVNILKSQLLRLLMSPFEYYFYNFLSTLFSFCRFWSTSKCLKQIEKKKERLKVHFQTSILWLNTESMLFQKPGIDFNVSLSICRQDTLKTGQTCQSTIEVRFLGQYQKHNFLIQLQSPILFLSPFLDHWHFRLTSQYLSIFECTHKY